MQEYVDTIMTLSNKLKGIGFAVNDDWLSAILLAGLNEEYKPFIMGIEATEAKITSDKIVYKLLDSEQTSHSNNQDEKLFLGFKSKKRNNDNKFRKKSCYNCGSKRHLSNTCDKEKVKKGQKDQQKPSTSANNAFPALQVSDLSTESKVGWYIDSGASSHMTPHLDLIYNHKPSHIKEIVVANNSKLSVNCSGKSTLQINQEGIEVRDVLHVPNLATNLLSISKMAEKGNKIIFDGKWCTVYDNKGCKIAESKAQNGVYLLKSSQERCMMSNNVIDARTWHRRMGHLNYADLKKMKNGAVTGMNFGHTEDISLKNCSVCCQGKQSRLPFPVSENKRASNILGLIHSDVVGPMENKSLGGARYLLTFIDDCTRKVFVYFLKRKSDVLSTFKQFKVFVENQTGKKIKILRTDNGGEYCSDELMRFFEKNGIHHQTTISYTPEQNGLAERMNRTLIEKAKCMLFDSGLGKIFWGEAVNTAAYLINRTVSSVLCDKTPEEIWTNKTVDVSKIRIFGSKIMVHVPKQRRRKLDAKSIEMIFVGYDSNKKGYRCINPINNKLIISRDVIFFENHNVDEVRIPAHHEGENVTGSKEDDILDEENETTGSSIEIEDNNITTIDLNSSSEEAFLDALSKDGTTSVEDTIVEGDDVAKDPSYKPRKVVIPEPNVRNTRSSKKDNLEPWWLGNYACLSSFTASSYFDEPQSIREIESRSDAQQWHQAIQEELKSLDENKTWDLVDLPKGQRMVKTKWIFKVKRDSDGKVSRYKARLVAKGFTQRPGIDYDQTFAPVVRYSSIRFLIALAVEHNLKIHQLDAITAFLQGDVEEDIYVEQPEGCSDGSQRVCKLNRALYGLKQASRQWNIKLDAVLKKNGLKKSKVDPCVYYSTDRCLILAVYVDDIMIFYSDAEQLEKLKSSLCSSFKMKDMGRAKSCLGIRLTYTDSGIALDQSNYINEILQNFGMQDSKPMGTPSDTSQKLSSAITLGEEKNDVPYQQVVGCLLYLSQCTRPDIAYAINDVSRFNGKHAEIHWKAVKRILRYLKGTVNYKLSYRKSEDYMISGYTDADWASDIDSRRSCTGYVFKLSNAAITWGSKRQKTVALSSTEAEYMALGSAVQEAIWLRQLAYELEQNLKRPINLYCDNQSTIKLAESEAYRHRTKHIDIRHHFVREMVLNGSINIEFVNTEENVADALTKAIPKQKFVYCTEQMGLQYN